MSYRHLFERLAECPTDIHLLTRAEIIAARRRARIAYRSMQDG